MCPYEARAVYPKIPQRFAPRRRRAFGSVFAVRCVENGASDSPGIGEVKGLNVDKRNLGSVDIFANFPAAVCAMKMTEVRHRRRRSTFIGTRGVIVIQLHSL